jgi:hypothetical protein
MKAIAITEFGGTEKFFEVERDNRGRVRMKC